MTLDDTLRAIAEAQAEIRALEEKTKDEVCPICGGGMKVKRSRFGYFLSCKNYPECKGISKIWNKTGFKCPNCLEKAGISPLLFKERLGEVTRPSTDSTCASPEASARRASSPEASSGQLTSVKLIGDVVERKSRGRGQRVFYGCNRYPDCTFLTNKKPESEADLVEALAVWKAKPPADAKKSFRKKPEKKVVQKTESSQAGI